MTPRPKSAPTGRPWRTRFTATALLLALIAAVAVSVACDPGEDVTLKNGTGVTVSVFREKDLEAKLAPGEQRTFSFIVYQGAQTFSAKDEAGNVIFQEQYTWDDLKRLNWRIVIAKK